VKLNVFGSNHNHQVSLYLIIFTMRCT